MSEYLTHTHTHTHTVCVCVCVCVCVYHTYMSSGLEGGYPSTIHAHTRCVYIYIYIYIYICIYEQWFGGWISKYHTRTHTHTVEYDDGEVIQEDLSKSKVRWLSTDHAAAARGGGGGGVADASGRGGRPIAKCQWTTVEEDQVATHEQHVRNTLGTPEDRGVDTRHIARGGPP
jgi:hypothetical protein